MLDGEDFSPHFSINYSGEEYPSRDQRSLFGYSPFDLYLKRDAENISQTRMSVSGSSASEFLESFDSEYLLIFRYKLDDVETARMLPVDRELEEMPVFQYDFRTAQLTPNQDLMALTKELERELDGSEVDYFQRIEASSEPTSSRPVTVSDFIEDVYGREICIFPSVEGIAEIDLKPDQMEAKVSQYSKTLKVSEKESGFRNPFIEDTSEEFKEIEFDYNNREVDEAIKAIESIGFEPCIEILPSTISPDYI